MRDYTKLFDNDLLNLVESGDAQAKAEIKRRLSEGRIELELAQQVEMELFKLTNKLVRRNDAGEYTMYIPDGRFYPLMDYIKPKNS